MSTASPSPSLRPTIFVDDQIHIGPLGGEHRDILEALPFQFRNRAVKFEFGFVDENGQFLNRKQALAYAKRHALLMPWVTADETELESDFLTAHANRL